MNETKLLALIKRFIESHKTQREAATALSISPGYLSDIVNGRRVAPDSVLKVLGLERIVTYRKAKPV